MTSSITTQRIAHPATISPAYDAHTPCPRSDVSTINHPEKPRMKKLLIAASLSLAVSSPAFAAGPQQGNVSFSLLGRMACEKQRKVTWAEMMKSA